MQRLQWLRLDPTHEGQRSQTRPILDVCGPMWGGVGQEHGVAVVAGKAGVVAGAAPAARTAVPAAPRQGLGGPRAEGRGSASGPGKASGSGTACLAPPGGPETDEGLTLSYLLIYLAINPQSDGKRTASLQRCSNQRPLKALCNIGSHSPIHAHIHTLTTESTT